MNKPLAGIKVLEIAHYMAGPSSSRDLLELGAEVVKIEPVGGEPTRSAHPFAADGTSFYYATFNFGKRSLELDLRLDESRQVLEELLRRSDVLVTNYSAARQRLLGFDYATVVTLNPALIMVHITGFGSWSHSKDFPAYDVTIQAMSGVASLIGEADGPPTITGIALADLATGQHATSAALTALFARSRTGKGALVEVSMMRAMTRFIGTPLSFAARGEIVTRHGNKSPRRFVNMFETADGYIVPSPITLKQWTAFCLAIGQPQWAAPDVAAGAPPRYLADQELRSDIEGEVARWCRARTSDEVVTTLLNVGVPCCPVLSLAEVIEVDRRRDLRLFDHIELVDGERMLVARLTPEWADGQREPEDRRVHAVGEDTADILAELGFA